MRYTQFIAFEKHLQSSAPSHFSQIYCLLIKDPSERSLAFSELKKYLSPCELHSYSGDLEGEKAFFRDIDTPSLFQTRQLYHLTEASLFSKAGMQRLEQTFKSLPKAAFIVLSAESLSKASSFYKALDKEGVLLEVAEEKPWEKEKSMTEWLMNRAQNAGVHVSSQAVNCLVKGSMQSLSFLSSEFEKLVTYAFPNKKIELEDVLAICTLTQTDSAWLMGESVLALNPKLGIESAFRSLEQGNSVFTLLRQLRHQMMTALYLVSGDQAMIHSKFPYLKGAMLDKQVQAATQFSSNRLVRALQLIDYYEFKAKDTWDDPKLLINMLLTRITE